MVISCFFCQNMLSDFIEGVLPSLRHEELKKHLDGCRQCTDAHKDLQTTIEVLKALPQRSVETEMELRIGEASQSLRLPILLDRRRIKKASSFGIALAILLVMAIIFPSQSGLNYVLGRSDRESQFVRFYPILQGATEILEEHSSWLHSREPLMGSLWEEGGLSPDEFEKTFQIKGGRDSNLTAKTEFKMEPKPATRDTAAAIEPAPSTALPKAIPLKAVVPKAAPRRKVSPAPAAAVPAPQAIEPPPPAPAPAPEAKGEDL